jgi:putative MFS transporter
VGTSAGYLLAAGSAALLEPLFSWRVLWLLGLPTGALIIVLDRFIPESPRFLAGAGLEEQARAVLAKFAGRADAVDADPAHGLPATSAEPQASLASMLRGPHAPITWGLLVCGVAWGLVNFGFLLWLPSNLSQMGLDAAAASGLLARSALLALPGIPLVIWLYHRWSSVGALVLFTALTAAALLGFLLLGLWGLRASAAIVLMTVLLLVSASGVIAMLIPYAAEIYPVHLRATGTGLIAASSKFGGILGALGGVVGAFNDLGISALAIAGPMVASAVLLLRHGVDTRGHGLEDIQSRLAPAVRPRRC